MQYPIFFYSFFFSRTVTSPAASLTSPPYLYTNTLAWPSVSAYTYPASLSVTNTRA